jgi:glycosyltransferase involved in cell wall biosynthesis
MIVVTHKGAPSPLIGRIKGIVVDALAPPPSVGSAISAALDRFRNEREGFVYVASGAQINTARLWPVFRRPGWDVAVCVDRLGSVPLVPLPFTGIGHVSLLTILVRPTDGGRRVVARWLERNAAKPTAESVNLAITLRETAAPVLHLSREWIWREEFRAFHLNAEPVVRFRSVNGAAPAVPAMKISALTSAAPAPKPVEPKAPSPGVLWVGHLYQYTGYGKANREILFRLANSMSVRIDDSHREPVYVKEDLRARLDVHKGVLVGPGAPLLRMMGPDHISRGDRHRIVWTMQESSVRVHEDMAKRANENFDELWTPSAWNAQVFRDSGVRLPIRVMPLGVDPVVFRPLGRRSLPPCRLISTARRGRLGVPDGFVFLTIGLPGFRKGWDVIADAAELAFRGKRNVHFVIGLTHSPPAWNAKIYRQFANYKIPIWTLEGSFDEHELAGIYCGANAYVSASRGEGFNLPAAEAAACGLPVIVPDNTCHTEIFGPEALLFRPDGVKTYPEGDWISDWYKGQFFSRFGVRSIRRLAVLMSDAVGSRGLKVEALREKITTKYTWDAAARRAASRLLEVQS